MVSSGEMLTICHLAKIRFSFLPPANKVCEGYVFTCVRLSTGGGGAAWYPSMPCRWYPSMPCRSLGGGIPACLAGFQAHTQGELEGSGQGRVSRPTPGGVSKHALRQTPPPAHLTAIAAGGKHLTGMHSCNKYCCRCNYVE